MKLETIGIIMILSWLAAGIIASVVIDDSIEEYNKGFEAGRIFERELLLNADSSKVKGCQFGYIPDSLYKMNLPELKDSGSYKIRGSNVKRRI